ncbi:MAG: hypothetical protein KGD68_14215 [Candidatus Lokiarchaeota archaeon]|nr:hypothetical protein [Candidatus Lokiarchaeota archaeon]
MNTEIIELSEKQIIDLKEFLKKIEFSPEEMSKEFNIKEVSSQISENYEKTISPGQAEAVMRRVIGKTLTTKERSQLYDLRKKIQRYEKFLTNFREWGIKYDYQLKVIILGLTEEQSDYLPQVFNKPIIAPERDVIGVNFLTKLTENFDKTLARLQIWDVAGQERFAFLRPQFYRGATTAILVFNKENRESFDMIKKYFNELKESTGLKIKLKIKRRFQKEISLPIALIATGSNSVIPYEEILSLAKDMGAGYFEIGNIEDQSFQDLFDGIAMTVLVRLQDNP